jgi:YVTN family beta-propeller protein
MKKDALISVFWPLNLSSIRHGIRLCSLFLTFGMLAMPTASPAQTAQASDMDTVGRLSPDDGRAVLPVGQIITPAGRQLDLPGMRPQAMALSPDGRLLAVSGKTSELVIVDPATAAIKQRVNLPPEPSGDDQAPDVVSPNILEPDRKGQVSYTGLVFSPDGRFIYLSNVNGSIKIFTVSEAGEVAPLRSLPLPDANAPRRKAPIPSGLAVSPNGKLLYVTLNLSNRLLELDIETGRHLRLFDVGAVPYDVRLAGNKAYVSNWGGRRPEPDSTTGPAGRGTLVRVDPVRHIASEGSISIIDLDTGKVLKEILTGLHCSGLALSPDGRYLAATNAGADTISVIDTATDTIVETISVGLQTADLFGTSPNALAFDPSGEHLFVCNGTQNAVAVVDFDPAESRLQGLIPVGWFPGAVVHDPARKALYVANIKGLGFGRPNKDTQRPEFNTHQYHGSLSLVTLPDDSEQLKNWTATVLRNCRRDRIDAALAPAREGQPARPIPERVGEPSVFKHVAYIIKENRTYDQVLGDMEEGNGDPNLCIFGERVTPNQHKMCREFVLLDNTYCSGILSADGHQWSDSAFATDYMEKSFAGFPRSYPDGMEDDDIDALAYSPGGFIWDSAIAAGKSLRVYGEFAITEKSWRDPDRKGRIRWMDHYRDFVDGTNLIEISSRPAIESLRPYINPETVGWDMDIPDVFRSAKFIEELKEYERSGSFPNLVIICLPDDHTSGTSAGAPTPAAQVADNDLAFAQIVEAIGKSPFWKETCIFAIEDDPQNGWDHVSGYRTTAYVISPYTKRGTVVSTQYNQPSMLRTIGSRSTR